MTEGQFYHRTVIIPATPQDDTRIVSPDKLNAHWKLEDVKDSWIHRLDWTNNGSVTFKKGKFGNCAFADGSNYLSQSHNGLLNPEGKDFEIAFHLRGVFADNKDTTEPRIIDKVKWKIFIDESTGKLKVTITDANGDTKTITRSGNILDGKFHSVIVDIDRDNDQLIVYVDKITDKTTADISNVTGSIGDSSNIGMFATASGNNKLVAEIDDVRIYKDGLRTTEQKKKLLGLSDRYTVGNEDRGGTLRLKNGEQSEYNLNISGFDKRFLQRYEAGSPIILLHDVIDQDELKMAHLFKKSLEDESVNTNILKVRNGSEQYNSDNDGLLFDGSTDYTVEDNEGLDFSDKLYYALKLNLPATDSNDTDYQLVTAKKNWGIYVDVHGAAANRLVAYIVIEGTTFNLFYTYTADTDFVFAVEFDGGKFKIFVDGSEEDSADVSGTGDKIDQVLGQDLEIGGGTLFGNIDLVAEDDTTDLVAEDGSTILLAEVR